MRSATFLLLCCTVPMCAQITVQLSPAGGGRSGYVVSAANHDSSARTPQEILDVNLKLAADGNTEADFQLGLAYLQGQGVQQDLLKAEQYFELGATSPDEKSLVATMYRNGWFPKNEEAAVHWLLAAGRPGDVFEVAQIYRTKNPPQLDQAARIYREMLKQTGRPEFRRAQMELGNLVLDGHYSAGEDAAGHAQNLEWARIITQELLGQADYSIAVQYASPHPGLPKDQALWQRFCRRAAAYNIDLAQGFYGRAILDREIAGASPYEGYAWVRLASDKFYSYKSDVQQLEKQMSSNALLTANSVFEGLIQTRRKDGAYYPSDDPLREPSVADLEKMPADDPDVQLRRAFALESSADPVDYQRALQLYRIARDRRGMDLQVVLGRDYLHGTNGVPQDLALAKYWLVAAAEAGSKPAALYMAKWYAGDGTTSDPMQALAWQLIGHEGSTAVIPPPELTQQQKLDAMQLYARWLVAHPGWVTPPSAAN